LSRRGAARVAAAVLAAVALVVFVVVMVASQSVRVLAVGLGLAAVSVIAAGYALTPAASVGDTERAPDALHPVLLMNPGPAGARSSGSGWSTCAGSRPAAPARRCRLVARGIKRGAK
jgi:hypothetical protein